MARDMSDVPEDLPRTLTYCSDDGPGYSRAPRAKGFSYRDPAGKVERDAATLDRIARLAIPPAWTDVWIAPRASCHIQATGRDVKGRKQYRYHADWSAARDASKYDRVAAFGRVLPKLRKRLDADLKKRGLPREKVLAAVISLLEQTLIRVGNDEYAKQNKSFGLTTMRKRHITLTGVGGVFEFRGKSGKMHATAFRDRRLARVVKACHDLRGQRLFQYRDADGALHDVTSGDVNDYLRAATGEDFTAKDFRTWTGTVEAARLLCARTDTTATKAAINECVRDVSRLLGNTPAVCRKAYIHPLITEAFTNRQLALKPGKSRRGFETAVIRMLEAT
jgi:DNA topoisomerase-1